MNDYLLRLSENAAARRVVASLGLPVSLPPVLARTEAPVAARPLEGVTVQLADEPGELRAALVEQLPALGAAVGAGGDVLVFDATRLATPEALQGLYDFFHPRLGALPRSGRVVVLGRPVAEAATAAAAGAQAALDGFVKSLAKELGKKGSTANLVRVGRGAEGRALPVVAFLASPRSAFVTGQPLHVDTSVKAPATVPLAQALAGKTAVVTGAANGIGLCTARALAREGARVLCVDRPQEQGALDVLTRGSAACVPVALDLSQRDAPARLVERVLSSGVDVVVHSAGITRDRTLAKMTAEQWSGVLDLNLAAVLRVHDALEPHLRDGGRVTVLSSIAGLAGNVGQCAYAATKAALVGWVQAKGAQLGPKGIAVNAVAPGFIETRMTATVPFMVREAARRLSALGQGGQPQDVAEVLTFLSSPGAAGLNGRTLRVCGGAFIGA